ncbi:1-phosphofructokinase family hexose kinase [Methanolobus zinderi]|uniref:1-phosphofructokinase family hexose kinase n=1 Tax=Methanolobus zinderi TaxID=536044 RepID=A0A7D5IBY3_9EURY|nr:1-phosphofructokinase family hexose kinase [Methanolobus zinderi]QLC50209.1 1-phosphofructokinase family hexose kinase [Methanolobus zinderi]
MSNIVTLTMNPTIDKSTSTDNVMAEHKIRCDPPSFEPGGGGVNVSRAIKKLGGESLLMYTSGGMAGQRLHNLLDQEDILQQPLLIEGMTRENFVVFERSTERQYRFGMPGPELKENEWESCIKELSSLDPVPDYIVASGSLPPGVPVDFYARVARIGKDIGARVIVDASGDALKMALEEGVYLIKPNIREFSRLLGQEKIGESEILDKGKKIVSACKCEIIVVSLGAGGALLLSDELVERMIPPAVPISSKVGAGDSMVAGIVLAMSRGKPLREAVLYGLAAGSAAVMTPGTELCRKEDTERLYAKMME